MIARFSIRRLDLVPGGGAAAGHSSPRAMDGIAPSVERPGSWHGAPRGSQDRADSIPSNSARIGTPAVGGDAPGADSRGPPSGTDAPRTSRASFSLDLRSLCGTVQRSQCSSHFLDQVGESTIDHGGPRHEHHRDVGLQGALLPAIRLAQTSPATVARHGATNAAARGESNAPAFRQRSPQHHKARPFLTIALPKERLDFRGPPKPVVPLQRKPGGGNTPPPLDGESLASLRTAPL